MTAQPRAPLDLRQEHGVETPEHLAMVRAAGCDLAQGWLLGQPMSGDDIPGWVRGVEAAGGDLCAQALSAHTVTAGS